MFIFFVSRNSSKKFLFPFLFVSGPYLWGSEQGSCSIPSEMNLIPTNKAIFRPKIRKIFLNKDPLMIIFIKLVAVLPSLYFFLNTVLVCYLVFVIFMSKTSFVISESSNTPKHTITIPN